MVIWLVEPQQIDLLLLVLLSVTSPKERKESPNINTLTLKEEIEAPPEVLEDRYNMRSFTLKRPGVFFLDFNNQEYRTAAYTIDDPEMAQAFIAKRDLHGENSQKLRINRDAAKVFVFQLFYGAGPTRLGLELTDNGSTTTTEEAKEIINLFMQQHPKLRKFIKIIKQADSIDTSLYG